VISIALEDLACEILDVMPARSVARKEILHAANGF